MIVSHSSYDCESFKQQTCVDRGDPRGGGEDMRPARYILDGGDAAALVTALAAAAAAAVAATFDSAAAAALHRRRLPGAPDKTLRPVNKNK